MIYSYLAYIKDISSNSISLPKKLNKSAIMSKDKSR